MFYYGLEWQSLDSYFQFKEITAPATPPKDELRVYAKDKAGTSALYLFDDAGNEREIAPPNTVTGTGTANRLAYWTGSSVIGAVGALNLNQILVADANGLPTGNASAVIKNLAAGVSLELKGTPNAFLKIDGDATGNPFIEWAQNTTFKARMQYLDADDSMAISVNGAERFRIGSAGQWGIAGATYGAALDVFTSGGASAAPTWTAPGALTKVDDTNVTLTLGGTPTTALLRAASLTLGWTGTLGVARGGTNISSYAVGDLLYASGATTLSKLADVAAGSYLRSGGVTTAPLWSTLILPNAATANRIAYATASNTWGESADLAFDGTDFLLGSSIRARMSGQNRFRYLNSMAKATNSSNTTVSTSTITIINWDTDEYDTDTIHDTGANTSRFTAKIAGKYLIECNLRYDTPGSSTGSVHVGWRLNGNSGSDKNIAAIPNSSSAVLLMVNAAIPVNLAANDYVEFWAFQNLGSNMTVNLNDSFGAITYIGE